MKWPVGRRVGLSSMFAVMVNLGQRHRPAILNTMGRERLLPRARWRTSIRRTARRTHAGARRSAPFSIVVAKSAPWAYVSTVGLGDATAGLERLRLPSAFLPHARHPAGLRAHQPRGDRVLPARWPAPRDPPTVVPCRSAGAALDGGWLLVEQILQQNRPAVPPGFPWGDHRLGRAARDRSRCGSVRGRPECAGPARGAVPRHRRRRRGLSDCSDGRSGHPRTRSL